MGCTSGGAGSARTHVDRCIDLLIILSYSSKPRTDRRERKASEDGRRDKTAIPSPYSKVFIVFQQIDNSINPISSSYRSLSICRFQVTDPRLVDGPPSSGRGSDDAASQCREKKRQSYSASSGYESAAGEYHSAYCK